MEILIEAIRAASAEGATAEQKATAATACRTFLAALESETGKAMTLPGTPTANPLAGIDPSQALDLLIAKLTAALPPDAPTAERPKDKAVRFAFVKPAMGTGRPR